MALATARLLPLYAFNIGGWNVQIERYMARAWGIRKTWTVDNGHDGQWTVEDFPSFDKLFRGNRNTAHRYSLSVASLLVYSAQIYEVDLIGENRMGGRK
jgi:hypothetical protein